MSTKPELTIITRAEAKALKLWALTMPFNTYTERNQLDKEVARLTAMGIAVVLVAGRPSGTAEIWRGGKRHVRERPYAVESINLKREAAGF